MVQEIVGSKMPADNGYGRNGYSGSSADTPGSARTNSQMAKDLFGVDVNAAYAKAGLAQRPPRPARMSTAARNARKQPTLPAPQTRFVSNKQVVPTTFGMKAPKNK